MGLRPRFTTPLSQARETLGRYLVRPLLQVNPGLQIVVPEANRQVVAERLAVQRLGQAQPSKLEISRERDRRSPTAKRAKWICLILPGKVCLIGGTITTSSSRCILEIIER